jgi:hypothetical protein
MVPHCNDLVDGEETDVNELRVIGFRLLLSAQKLLTPLKHVGSLNQLKGQLFVCKCQQVREYLHKLNPDTGFLLIPEHRYQLFYQGTTHNNVIGWSPLECIVGKSPTNIFSYFGIRVAQKGKERFKYVIFA